MARPQLFVVVRHTRALSRFRLMLESRHNTEIVVLVTGREPGPQWAGIRDRVLDPEVDAVMLVGDYQRGFGWEEIARQLRVIGWPMPVTRG